MVKDYICPPHILSSETTENETVWSLGEYLTGKQVWENFKLPGSPPQAIGVYENQPSPYGGRIKRLWQVCLALLAALVVMAIFGAVLSSREEVFSQDYVFSQQAPGEHSFVTDVFELKGHPSNVEISIQTDLNNNWAYFDFTLINEDTGQAYDFGREVSYYHGSDSDGPWTEGSSSDDVIVPQVPDGRYYLRVEPEMDVNAPPVVYQLSVRRGVLSGSIFRNRRLAPDLAGGLLHVQVHQFRDSALAGERLRKVTIRIARGRPQSGLMTRFDLTWPS